MIRACLCAFVSVVLLIAALPTGLTPKLAPWGKIPSVIYFNYSHPLALGLKVFIPFQNFGATIGIGYTNPEGLDTTVQFTGTGLSWTTTPWGFGVTGFANNAGRLTADNTTYMNNALPLGSSPRTVAALYRLTNLSATTDKTIVFWGSCGSSTDGWFLIIGANSNAIRGGDTGATNNAAWTPDLNWHIALSQLPTGSTNAFSTKVGLDGRFLSITSTSGSDNTVNTTGGFVIGDAPGGCTLTSTNIIVGSVWVWNRTLDANQFAAFYNDPFGMIYDSGTRIRLQSGSGATSGHQVFIIQP